MKQRELVALAVGVLVMTMLALTACDPGPQEKSKPNKLISAMEACLDEAAGRDVLFRAGVSNENGTRFECQIFGAVEGPEEPEDDLQQLLDDIDEDLGASL